MSELVEFLARGKHPVELPRYQAAAELKECLERAYVLVKFTDTRGGTELGVRLDASRCDVTRADFAAGTGTAKFVGHLNLDFTDIECVVDIDLATLKGNGGVTVVAAA